MIGAGVMEAKPPEADSVLEIVQNFRLNISRFLADFYHVQMLNLVLAVLATACDWRGTWRDCPPPWIRQCCVLTVCKCIIVNCSTG